MHKFEYVMTNSICIICITMLHLKCNLNADLQCEIAITLLISTPIKLLNVKQTPTER